MSGGSRRRPWVGKAELGCPAYQASLSLTNSWSLLKLIPIESMMPPTVSFPITPFFSRPQSFPASGCFPVSGLLASGGQSIGALASVLSMNIQDLFPLRWTRLTSLQSKGLSRVFSNTTVQKHQFFSAQVSLWSSSHIIHDYWKTIALTRQTFVSNESAF